LPWRLSRRAAAAGRADQWQYKILIAILITGAILLYSAPKSVSRDAKRVCNSSGALRCALGTDPTTGPAQIAGPVRTPAEVQAALLRRRCRLASSPRQLMSVLRRSKQSALLLPRGSIHCAKATAEVNTDESLKSCEHGEIDAWDRVVLDREFPAARFLLDRRCSERPFPADSFVLTRPVCARC